jgi:(S)-2-hydroxyglutarate dehydrogenase
MAFLLCLLRVFAVEFGSMTYDVVVVGGGLLGLGTAWQLLRARPGLKLAILEKEGGWGRHQSGHNSGVLHAGVYYKPGSEKARLSVQGLKYMVAFCREHGIPYELCGKIVLATTPEEVARLDTLWERGNANGLKGLRRLGPEQIREIEPHAVGLAAIHVPEEGIVDYPAVSVKLAEVIAGLGGKTCVNTGVLAMRRTGSEWTLETTAGDFQSKYVVTCGGLYSDRLARAAGLTPKAKIIPFRGEYYMIRPERQFLARHLIYPVPDPKFPFLGVHFTRMVRGGVEVGPNAVLAFAREGYRWTKFNVRDLAESLAFPGLWRFLMNYPQTSFYEVYRSLSRAEFCRSLQKMVPEIRLEDLLPGGSGVRAQAMSPEGRLVEDFSFEMAPGILHVVNAPSPAATASLAIGETIAGKVTAEIPK